MGVATLVATGVAWAAVPRPRLTHLRLAEAATTGSCKLEPQCVSTLQTLNRTRFLKRDVACVHLPESGFAKSNQDGEMPDSASAIK